MFLETARFTLTRLHRSPAQPRISGLETNSGARLLRHQMHTWKIFGSLSVCVEGKDEIGGRYDTLTRAF